MRGPHTLQCGSCLPFTRQTGLSLRERATNHTSLARKTFLFCSQDNLDGLHLSFGNINIKIEKAVDNLLLFVLLSNKLITLICAPSVEFAPWLHIPTRFAPLLPIYCRGRHPWRPETQTSNLQKIFFATSNCHKMVNNIPTQLKFCQFVNNLCNGHATKLLFAHLFVPKTMFDNCPNILYNKTKGVLL